MATVTGLTAERMEVIEAASVVGGTIDGSGHLILTRHDGSTIDAGPILAIVPNASTSVVGIIEIATNAEVASGVNTTKAVTPAGVVVGVNTLVPSASTSAQGKVELATSAETITGTDGIRAVTPAGLASAVPVSSTTAQGKVELATSAETITGTDASRAVTPAGLAAASAKGMVPGGYAEISANVNSSNSSAATTITGLSVTVTVASDRRYKISTFTRLQNTVAGRLVGYITDSILGGIQNGNITAAIAGVQYPIVLERILVAPASGPRTFSAQFQSLAGGSITCAAATSATCHILVEDIGPV